MFADLDARCVAVRSALPNVRDRCGWQKLDEKIAAIDQLA